jgi:sterol desaturase/sphingolipid hydroxylase (fatty acid hydroxylase superfamily)
MDSLGPNALIAVVVLPIFYLGVYLDYALCRLQGRDDYELKDTVTSLGVSVLMSAFGVIALVLRIAIYTLAFEAAALGLWSLASPWTWVIGLLLYDFSYYWQHRMGHEVNLLWASHVVHHSSDRFNLATALRVPSASMHLWTWIFALPLAVLGVPPVVYAVASLLNLLYQFWIHTERVGRLGWFDRWFGSPSNHRVHHGVNERYLDKNYGGILMLWDRMFGTYEIEFDDEKVRYGTRAPVRSWNPLWVNLHTPWNLLRESRRTARWRDRLQLWLRPPAWRPADLLASDPRPAFDLAQHHHHDSPLLAALGAYCLLQMALLPPQLVHLIAVAAHVGWGAKILYASYLGLATIALGLLLDERAALRRLGTALEAVRLLAPLALIAATGQWFGGWAPPPWAVAVILAVTVASLYGLLRAQRPQRDVDERLAVPVEPV